MLLIGEKPVSLVTQGHVSAHNIRVQQFIDILNSQNFNVTLLTISRNEKREKRIVKISNMFEYIEIDDNHEEVLHHHYQGSKMRGGTEDQSATGDTQEEESVLCTAVSSPWRRPNVEAGMGKRTPVCASANQWENRAENSDNVPIFTFEGARKSSTVNINNKIIICQSSLSYHLIHKGIC